MRTPSLFAVMSPLMSTTATPSTRRTSMVAVSALILPPLSGRLPTGDGGLFVGIQLHEVREPGDLEDLPVVIGQSGAEDLPRRPCAHRRACPTMSAMPVELM